MTDNRISFETPEKCTGPKQGMIIEDNMTNEILMINELKDGHPLDGDYLLAVVLSDGTTRKVTNEYFIKNCSVIPNGTKLVIHTNYF